MSDMASPLKAAKQQLRALMKQRLANITQEAVNSQSLRVFDTLSTFKPYLDARHVSIFLSMPTAEIQTDAIVRDALDKGKHVYIPYLHKAATDSKGGPSRVMDMVRLKNLQDYESLQPDRWGIPSIDPDSIPDRQRVLGGKGSPSLDLMLMPGVAFDIDEATGSIRRLGHGRGFYDYFLHRYLDQKEDNLGDSRTPILLYGLALTEQFLSGSSEDEVVPTGQLDEPLHGLILGNGDIKSARQGHIKI